MPFPASPRRRGVTLVEMLVVVALVVLMMTILVQIFQATTGTMQASRTIQELDLQLRLLDQTIRQDLQGATARFTPPLNPVNNLGYFEYGENAFADFQGEDGDDYLAFTTRAPEGQFFTGRQWLSNPVVVGTTSVETINQNIQPTTISSRLAEVIYFVRNQNLYRRTFLVVPERAKSISLGKTNFAYNYPGNMFGLPGFNTSWLGMNDISAHPSGFNLADSPPSALLKPIPNTLADLTNRENRAFRPRFSNDFYNTIAGSASSSDNIPDDGNADDVADYYPTLYYDGKGTTLKDPRDGSALAGWAPNSQMYEGSPYTIAARKNDSTYNYDIYAFPFIYPGMYSKPQGVSSNTGWIHYLYPATVSSVAQNNHNPLDVGEDQTYWPTDNQTWFGFPTWRETMVGANTGTVGWKDPLVRVEANSYTQPLGLRPFDPTIAPTANTTDAKYSFPSPVYNNGTKTTPFKYDTAGSVLLANGYDPGVIWEDDLVMTNVRSFDIKAYDEAAPSYIVTGATTTPPGLAMGYYDLGYASNPLYAGQTGSLDLTSGLNSTTYSSGGYLFQPAGSEPVGFGGEGRIPSLSTDFRRDPRRGYLIGDDNAGVVRLRRVFDTWSTDYTNAPQTDINGHGYPPFLPIYPAFPAPYPTALRGIQIQIRVTDPRNERPKVLTIRQDFTDKL